MSISKLGWRLYTEEKQNEKQNIPTHSSFSHRIRSLLSVRIQFHLYPNQSTPKKNRAPAESLKDRIETGRLEQT